MEFFIWMLAFTYACTIQLLGYQSQRETFFKVYLLIMVCVLFIGILSSLIYFKEQKKNFLLEIFFYSTKLTVVTLITIIISRFFKMDFFSLFEMLSFIAILINNRFKDNINKKIKDN